MERWSRAEEERQLCSNLKLFQCVFFPLLKSSAHEKNKKKKMPVCFDMFKMPQVVSLVLCLSLAFV